MIESDEPARIDMPACSFAWLLLLPPPLGGWDFCLKSCKKIVDAQFKRHNYETGRETNRDEPSRNSGKFWEAEGSPHLFAIAPKTIGITLLVCSPHDCFNTIELRNS